MQSSSYCCAEKAQPAVAVVPDTREGQRGIALPVPIPKAVEAGRGSRQVL